MSTKLVHESFIALQAVVWQIRVQSKDFLKEMFEDIKGLIRSHKLQTDNTMAKRRTDNTMAKRRTDNTMAKRRTDNTMAERRTDNTMAKRRTDNTMAKRRAKGQIMIYN
jgi:formate-dependent nitrite reductase cytochrome c552 subunit